MNPVVLAPVPERTPTYAASVSPGSPSPERASIPANSPRAAILAEIRRLCGPRRCHVGSEMEMPPSVSTETLATFIEPRIFNADERKALLDLQEQYAEAFGAVSQFGQDKINRQMADRLLARGERASLTEEFRERRASGKAVCRKLAGEAAIIVTAIANRILESLEARVDDALIGEWNEFAKRAIPFEATLRTKTLVATIDAFRSRRDKLEMAWRGIYGMSPKVQVESIGLSLK